MPAISPTSSADSATPASPPERAPADPGRIARPAVSLQTLRQVPLLAGLSEARLAALAQDCHWHHYEAGYTIPSLYTAGFCILATGRMLITTYEQSGRQVAFQVLGPGDCFGVVSLLIGPDGCEPVVAVTQSPSLIAQLDPTLFTRLMHEDHGFAVAMATYLAQAVRRFSQRIVELSTLTVRGRLLATLLRMAHRVGVQANRARFDPPPRHQVLANYVGTNREQITREMSWLQREGLAAKDGKALVLPDVAALQARVEQVRAGG
ncbi:MAG: Crp/Fnr family transcriptional regulator [Comamonas sp.]